MQTTEQIMSRKPIAELAETLTLHMWTKNVAQIKVAELRDIIAEAEAKDYSKVKRDDLVTMARERGLKIGGRLATKFNTVADLRAALADDDAVAITEWIAEIELRQQTIAQLEADIDELNFYIQKAEEKALIEDLADQVEQQASESDEDQPAGRIAVKNLKSRVLPIGYEIEIIAEGQPNGVEAFFNGEHIGSFDTIVKAHRAIGKHAPKAVELPDGYQVETVNDQANGMSFIYKRDDSGAYRPINDKGEFVEEVHGPEHCYRVKSKQAVRLVLRLAGVLDQYMSR